MSWLLIAGAVWIVTALPLAVAVGRAFAAAEAREREVYASYAGQVPGADRRGGAAEFPSAQAG